MNKFAGLIINNYGWFLFISIILILALIGYFVDQKKAKNNPYKIEKKEEEINLESLSDENSNVSLQSMLNKNKSIDSINNSNTPDNL